MAVVAPKLMGLMVSWGFLAEGSKVEVQGCGAWEACFRVQDDWRGAITKKLTG